MHLTAQTLTIIGIPLLVIPAVIIGFSGVYYSSQAGNNLKPASKWRKSRNALMFAPNDEFTELGVRYRRRSVIMALLLVSWWFVILAYWVFATWLTS
jgi:hypothetical protein